jgi:tetratricopeptide (TPR) repeat protein
MSGNIVRSNSPPQAPNRRQRRAMPKSSKAATSRTWVAETFAAALREHQSGKHAEAAELYRRILMVNPRQADCLHLLGVIALDNGDADRAIMLISRSIAINATEATFHFNLGIARKKRGELEPAADCFVRATRLRPDYAKAHQGLGTVRREQGRLTEAEACFRAAMRHAPDAAEAHDNLGVVLQQLGRYDEAIEYHRRAIALRPDLADAHNNLGTALLASDRVDAAIEAYRRALASRPDHEDAHFNLGTAMLRRGSPAGAIAPLREAVRLQPGNADAQLNLGCALQELEALDAAALCFGTAIAIDSELAEAHSNLGIVLLAQGAMPEGWLEHEWRWDTPQLSEARREFPRPVWRGEPISGQTLLIHAEQGLGDTLQFCRYARLAAARGARIIMEVQPPLVRLLNGLAGVDVVLPRGGKLPGFDWHCPMLSLPLALGTKLASIPGDVPYLRPDAIEAASWCARLAGSGDDRPRVGVVWAGDARRHSRALTAVDRRRSLAVERLAPLLEMADVRFFSLQKDSHTREKLPLEDHMAEMRDFADTAALIANLDLIISVDTAVAHAAGALGKPVWLLDRFDSCWRWLRGRDDSPWYPTLRIYRQPQPGDWDTVLDRITRDLRRCWSGSHRTLWAST